MNINPSEADCVDGENIEEFPLLMESTDVSALIQSAQQQGLTLLVVASAATCTTNQALERERQIEGGIR